MRSLTSRKSASFRATRSSRDMRASLGNDDPHDAVLDLDLEGVHREVGGQGQRLPVRTSKREPWRGQMATHSSGSKSPSQSGPSSCEQRSSIA